jgi:PPP family 3-phenylpropionic acid transporter
MRFKEAVVRKEVIAFLLVCSLIQLSHGPYYTFYTLLLEQQGYSKTLAGSLWALGVVAEVILFIYAHKLFHWVSEYWVLSLSVMLTIIRWLLIAYFPDKLSVLIFAQLLHAASYGSFHAASMRIVHDYFPGRLETHGQALYASASFGVGGALGALYAGYCWEYYGASFSYITAAMICVFTTIVAMLWVRPLQQPQG